MRGTGTIGLVGPGRQAPVRQAPRRGPAVATLLTVVLLGPVIVPGLPAAPAPVGDSLRPAAAASGASPAVTEPWRADLRQAVAAARAGARRDVRAVIEAVPLRDVPAVVRELDPLRDPRLLPGLLARWVGHDPAATLDWAQHLGPAGRRHSVLREVAEALARTHPVEAMELAYSLPGGSGNDTVRRHVLDQWVRSDLIAAVDWLQAQPPARSRTAFHTIASPWLQTDPQAAAEYLRRQYWPWAPMHLRPQHWAGPGRWAIDPVGAVAGAWASTDPVGAWPWACSLPEWRSRLQAQHLCLRSLVAHDPWQAVALATGLPCVPERERACPAVAKEWLVLDPAQAVVWLACLPPEHAAQAAWNEAARELDWVDTPALWVAPAGRRPPAESAALEPWRLALRRAIAADQAGAKVGVSRFLDSIAATDLPAVCGSHELHQVRDGVLLLVSRWAREDPRGAAAHIATMPPGRANWSAAMSLAAFWGETEPAAALEWVRSLPPGRVRQALLDELLGLLAAADPAQALEQGLAAEAQRRHGANPLGPVLAAWTRRDAAGAVAWIRAQPPARRREVFTMIVEPWAEADPRAAAEHLLAEDWTTDTTGHAQIQAARTVVDRWSAADFPAAWAWVRALPAGDLQTQAMEKCLSRRSWEEPRSVVGMVTDLPPGAAREHLYSAYVERWLDADPVAFLEWLTERPDGPEREQGLARVAVRFASVDADTGWALAQVLPPGRERCSTLAAIGATWARDDLAEALAAVQALADPAEQAAVSPSLVEPWVSQEPAAVLTYLLAMPAGEARSELVARATRALCEAEAPGEDLAEWMVSLAESEAETIAFEVFPRWAALDPPAAAAIAAQLPLRCKGRNTAVSAAFEAWAASDQAAARAWLDRTDLPAETKAGLLSRLEAAEP